MDTVNIVSFPGLGIGEITMNTVAFSLFGRDIAWYGIIVTTGIIAAFLYAFYRSRFEGVSSDDLLDLAIAIIICGIVGARAYYVLMRLDNYHSFLDMIAVWKGGLAIYGGIIGGFIAAFVVAKVKKLSFPRILDMVGPGVMLGQAIGRWGNFVNAEAYGSDTSLPWRMGLHEIAGRALTEVRYVHPTFIYESLWNVIGFVLINLFYKKKRFNGQVFLFYMTWYGFGRMLIEGLRTDSLYIGDIRVSQAVGLLTFIAGITMLIIFGIKAGRHTAVKLSVPQTNENQNENETEKAEDNDGKAD